MTGEAWRLRREEKGLTLRELARRVGISAPHQSDVEHGRRRYSAETESKVREALGMEPAPEEPEHRCRVCGGALTIHDYSEYLGDPMHMIIGPGHANQLTRRRAIYCGDCGVSYHHLPRESVPSHSVAATPDATGPHGTETFAPAKKPDAPTVNSPATPTTEGSRAGRKAP